MNKVVEVKFVLEFLDDVDRDSVKTDGKVIAYQASTGTFIGVTNSGGGGGGTQSLNQVLIEGNTSNLGMDVGIITATSFIGDVTGTASNASQLNNNLLHIILIMIISQIHLQSQPIIINLLMVLVILQHHLPILIS